MFLRITTTSVHPILYSNYTRTDYKTMWGFTEARIKKLNYITKTYINANFKNDNQVEMVDIWPITRWREDDPMYPTDIRHYGVNTELEILNQIFTQVCNFSGD